MAFAPAQIIVYIITQNPRGASASNVKKLFSNPIFHIHRLSLTETPNGVVNDETQELAHITGCLRHSQDNFKDNYFIVVKDTSVSVAGPEKIANVVSKCIGIGGWDIFYLCEWQERCDLLSNFQQLDDTSVSAAKTQNARGVQAILISPTGREMLLGLKPMRNSKIIEFNGNVANTLSTAVVNGALLAQTTVPNLINYDIKQATKPEDFLKGAQCAVPPGVVSYQQTGLVPLTNSTNSLSNISSNWWVWLIVIIIIIVIIIGVAAYYRNRREERED